MNERSVILVEANSIQKTARDRLTFSDWGKPLSMDSYLRREQYLRSQSWAQESMKTWLLWDCTQDLCFSSCETFAMQSQFLELNGKTFGIASVYTEPQYRNQGWASLLLKKLGEELFRNSQNPQALILFSEVGASIYEKLGYKKCENLEYYLDLLPKTSAGTGKIKNSEARFFTHTDASHLWTQAQAEVSQLGGNFQVLTSQSQLDWYLARERFYHAALRTRLPSEAGVRIGESLLFWVNDLRTKSLKILSGFSNSASETQTLMSCAQEIASTRNLDSLRVWSTEPLVGLSEALPWDRKIPNYESLPMILPIHPSLACEDWKWISRSSWV